MKLVLFSNRFMRSIASCQTADFIRLLRTIIQWVSFVFVLFFCWWLSGPVKNIFWCPLCFWVMHACACVIYSGSWAVSFFTRHFFFSLLYILYFFHLSIGLPVVYILYVIPSAHHMHNLHCIYLCKFVGWCNIFAISVTNVLFCYMWRLLVQLQLSQTSISPQAGELLDVV